MAESDQQVERPFTSAVATVRLDLKLPEDVVAKIVSSGESYEDGLISVECWVRDNLPDALQHCQGEAEVEAHA
jgi:hypothetical protein